MAHAPPLIPPPPPLPAPVGISQPAGTPNAFHPLLLTPARAFESYARNEDARIHFQPDDSLFLLMSGGTVRIAADSTTAVFYPAARLYGQLTWSDNGMRFLAQRFESNQPLPVLVYNASNLTELPWSLPHASNATLSADATTLVYTVGDDDETPSVCSWHIEVWNAVTRQPKNRICLDATNVGHKGPIIAGLSLSADGRFVGVQGGEYSAVISTATGKTVLRSAHVPKVVDSGVFAGFIGSQAIVAEVNKLSIFDPESERVRRLTLNCALGSGMWTHQVSADFATLLLNCGIGVMALDLASGKHRSLRTDLEGIFSFCGGNTLCKADYDTLSIAEPTATKFHQASSIERQNRLFGLNLTTPVNFDDPALPLDAGERIVLKEADGGGLQLSPQGHRVVLYRNGAVHVLALPSFVPILRLGDLWPVANTHNRGIDFKAYVAIENENLALYPDGPEGPRFVITIKTLLGEDAVVQTADASRTALYHGTTGRMTEAERAHTLGTPILTSATRPITGWYTRGFEVPQTIHYVENGVESETDGIVFGKGYVAFARHGQVELLGDKKAAEQVVLCTDGHVLAPPSSCLH